MNTPCKSLLFKRVPGRQLSSAMDVNTFGSYSHYEIPIRASFGRRSLSISFLFRALRDLPATGPKIAPITILSFYWSLSFSGGSAILRRPLCPETTFLPCDSTGERYICPETGESLRKKGNAGDLHYVLRTQDGMQYAFALTGGVLERILCPDGFWIDVSLHNGVLTLLTRDHSGTGASCVWHADFDFSTGSLSSFEIYRMVGSNKYLEESGSFSDGLSASLTIRRYTSSSSYQEQGYSFASSISGSSLLTTSVSASLSGDCPGETHSISVSGGSASITTHRNDEQSSTTYSLIEYGIGAALFTSSDQDYAEYFAFRGGAPIPRVASVIASDGGSYSALFDENGRIKEEASGVGGNTAVVERKNLLSNGSFESGISYWSASSSVSTVSGLEPPQFPFHSAFGSTWAKLPSGATISQSVSETILGDEPACLSVFIGQKSIETLSEVMRATITLHFLDGSSEIVEHSLSKEDCGRGHLRCAAWNLTREQAISSFDLTITAVGAQPIFLKAVLVIRGASSRRYKYLENTDIVTDVAVGNRILRRVLLDDRETFVYGEAASSVTEYYGDTDLPIRQKDVFGSLLENTYSNIPYPYAAGTGLNPVLTKSEYTAFDGLKTKNEAVSFDMQKWLPTSIEEEGLSKTISYDYLGNVSSSLMSGRSVGVSRDAWRRPSSYSVSSSGASGSNVVAYSGGRMTSFSDPTSRAFSLIMDGEKNIKRVDDPSSHEEYSYNVARIVSAASYGSDVWSFTYVEDDYPSLIRLSRSGSVLEEHTFTYYGSKVLYTEGSIPSGYQKTYGYEAKMERVSETTSVSGSTAVVRRSFADGVHGGSGGWLSSGGLESAALRHSPQKWNSAEFDSFGKKMQEAGCKFASFEASGDFSLYPASGSSVAPTSSESASTTRVDNLPCASIKKLEYTFPFAGNFPTFGFLFKGKTSGQVASIRIGSGSVSFSISFGSVIASGASVSGSQTCGKVDSSGWTAISFAVSSPTKLLVAVGPSFKEISLTQTMAYGSTAYVTVGVTSGSQFYAAAMFMANSSYSFDRLGEYNREAERAYMPCSVMNAFGQNAVGFVNVDAMMKSSGAYGSTRAIPLNGDLLSSDGARPLYYSARRWIYGSTFDASWAGANGLRSAVSFKTRKEDGKQYFNAYGEVLAYQVEDAGSGCIRLRFLPYWSGVSGRRYIFAFQELGKQPIACYLEGSALYLEANGSSFSTGILAVAGSMHDIGLTYAFSATSPSGTNSPTVDQLSLSLWCDGMTYEKVISVNKGLGNSYLILGRSPALTLSESASLPLHGLIGDVLLGDAHVSQSALASMRSAFGESGVRVEEDSLGRVLAKTQSINGVLRAGNKYVYASSGGYETHRLASEQLYSNASTVWKSISYAYDSAGLLSSFDGASVSYNHLGFIGSALGETVGYDAAGNIASRSQGGVSYTYSYLSSGLANRINSISGSNGWSRSYSYSGNSLGFPTAISESGPGAKSLSFSYHGELLHQAVTPSGTFTYYYDAKGRRIRKVGPSESHVYAYENDCLVLDTVIGGRAIHYIYGSDGVLAFVLLNQDGSLSRYAASVDAMGRLLRLSSEDGSYAEYSYSLWGEPTLAYDNTPAGIGSLNRLLFKCYPYDNETGFYSLGSRHYDPKSGRFLEPDPTGYLDPTAMAGLNLYAYCNNDPVNYTDRTGHFAISILIATGIGLFLGAVGGTVSSLVSDYKDNGSIDGSIGLRSYLGTIIGSAIGGAALGFAGGAGAAWLAPAIAGTGSAAAAWGGLALSAGVSFAGGFLNYSADRWISGKEWDYRKALFRGGLTAIEGMVAFGAGGVSSLVNWEGGKTINIGKKAINVPETIAQNFVSDIFGNPTGWLLDLIMDYYA